MTLSDAEVERASGFLRAHLDSHEQLEALRLLAGGRERSWTAGAVGGALGVAADVAARALDHLCARNLLDIRIGEEALFRFSPGSEALRGEVEAFLQALRDDPAAVARLMDDRLRARE